MQSSNTSRDENIHIIGWCGGGKGWVPTLHTGDITVLFNTRFNQHVDAEKLLLRIKMLQNS